MYRKAEKLLAGILCICMIMTVIIPPTHVYAEEESPEVVSGEPGEGSGSADDQAEDPQNNDAGVMPAAEDESGKLTMENHSLKWISGSSKTVIENDAMTITPTSNSDVAVKAQLTYSCGGNEGVEQGMSEIRLPRYVYYGRDGKPIGTVELSIPMAPATGGATSFNYYFDDHGTPDDPTDDEIVITNYKAIQPGGFFMKADIVWKFNAVDVANGFSNENVQASFTTQGNGGGDALTAESEKLSTTVNTKVSSKEPSKTADIKRENWQAEWGPKPADADDYYYVVWTMKQQVNTSSTTTPYTVRFEEMPGAIDADGNTKDGDQNKGEVAAWANYSFYNGGKPTANGTGSSTDFKTGTKEQMDQDVVAANTTRNQINGADSYIARDVVMRYPKANIPAEGETPKLNNGFKSIITTAEGEVTEKVALGSYIYQRVSFDVPYPGDGLSMYKRQQAGYSTSYSKSPYSYAGALNLLRAGKPVEADWSIDVKNMSWNRTENGTKPYDTVLRDGMMYVAGERLQPEDYELTKFYPAQYDVYLPAYDEDKGAFLAISGDYENQYAPIKVEVKDAAGNWSEYGSITKTGDKTYKWEGADGTTQTGTYTDNKSSANGTKAIPLPAGTQDIRYTHTGTAYGVEYRMGLYYSLKPSEHLMGLVGDSTTSFNLININEAWGAQEDANGNKTIYTPGNEFNNTSTPTIKADVTASDNAEFGGNSVVMHDYAEHRFTAIEGTGAFSKAMSGPYNETAAQRVRIPVTLTWDYYYNFSALGVGIEDAISAEIIKEAREADFYDLLPPGVDVDMSSLKVRTYSTTNVDKQTVPPCDYTVEMKDNWRGSGRTMMIIHVKAPDGYRNYANSTTWVDTGFVVNFNMYDSWDNIETNGIGLENNAAFYSKDGKVPGGVSDTGEGSADKALFENLGGGAGESGLKNNVKYKTSTINVDVPRAAQMGFSKKVKGAADTGYSGSTTVPATGDYSYQLRYALQDKAKAKGVVLYDVLETAYDANAHWAGKFTGIDVSQITRQFPDIDLKIYYSTSKDFGDLQAPGGEFTDLTNGNLWSDTAPADPGTVTAIAVDMSRNKDGSETQFEGPISLSAVIAMKAPENYKDYIDDLATANQDETVYAYNQAFMKQGNEKPEGSETTKVAIKKPDVKIEKSSTPTSGTTASPKTVLAGSTIDYVLKVSNDNGADAVTGVEVVDTIPDGLEIDEAALAFYFGSQVSAKAPADGTGRVGASVEGQKVTFTIDKLDAKEYVRLFIPVKVKDDTAGGTRFDNKAKITKFNDREWDDFESNETHHRTASVSLSLPVVKKFTGQTRPVQKTFNFILESTNGGPMPSAVNGNKLSITDGSAGSAFSTITFTKPGDYTYTVREEAGNEDGYSYDATVHHITVHVEESNGTLKASWTDAEATAADGKKITFTNDYTPISTVFAIPVEKNLGGDPVPPGHTEDFEFTLYPGASTNPMPDDGKTKLTITGLDSSDDGKDKKSAFGSMTFTKAGTYVYQIKETIGNTPGYQYAYDISSHTVTLKVTDENGRLKCTWLEQNASNGYVTFRNNYEPTAGIIDLDVSKLVTGNAREAQFKKSFTFTLSQPEYTGDYDYAANHEDLPMPASATTTIVDSGSAKLGQIAIKHAGTYTYTISEEKGNAQGYTYDTNRCKAVVTATDIGGTIQCTISYQFVDKNGTRVNASQFVNEYKPTEAEMEFEVEKTITGDAPAEYQKKFTFKVVPENGAPMPADGKDTIEITGADTGKLLNVGPFTETGTYTYTISETKGSDKGYAYSEDKYTVTVTVSDNDGVLEAQQTIRKNGTVQDAIVFDNTYRPTAVEYTPLVKKLITGNARPDDQKQKFTFALEAQDGAPMPAGTGNQAEITDQGDGMFGSINFTAAGTYRYSITETAGNAGGYTYSENVCTLVVTVKDNDGELQASAAYQNTKSTETGAAEFTNEYEPEPVSHAVEVKKTITGNDRPEDNKKTFTFLLTPVDDAPMSDAAVEENGVLTDKASVTDEGTASFHNINYTEVGTYKYEVIEKDDGETGYTYSGDVIKVTVKVTDDHGTLKKEVTYRNGDGDETTFTGPADKNDPADTPKVVFKNAYHPVPTDAVLSVEKTIVGNDRPEDDRKDFTFTLTAKDGAPMPKAGGETAVITDEGTADFGKITFDKAGTFTYEVAEADGGENAYTYSTDTYEVVVTVTDDDGTLKKEVSYSKDGNEVERMSFENEYHPEAAVLTLPVTKEITGGKPKTEETYSFKLIASGDEPMPEKDTIEIKGAGSADFGEITYTEVGTYTYAVSEVEGSSKDCTYDKTVYKVEVTVTDDDGTLKAEWKADGKEADALTFVNHYKEDKVTVSNNGKAGTGRTQTGDSRQPFVWAVLAALSVLGIAAALIMRRRREDR